MFLENIFDPDAAITPLPDNIFGIQLYAICILTGVIIAVLLGIKEAKKLGVASDNIYSGLIMILPFAIIGARIWYILFNIEEFKTNGTIDWGHIFGFQNGSFVGLSGLAIQGGIMAAIILIPIVFMKKKHLVYKIFDIVAPGFLIGQICGRWGNFFNQELYGPEIKNPGFISNIPFLGDQMYIGGKYHHPTFLYEALLNLGGLILMLVLRRKSKKLKSGDLMAIYLMWYGMARIPNEVLRFLGNPNDPLTFTGVPGPWWHGVSIWMSVLFIVVGAVFFIVKRFKGPKDNYLDIVKDVEENKLDTILFDLDGTLLNTKPLIDRSFVHTFKKFRPEMELTEEQLDSFFGPTLHQTFSKFSDDENEINEMVEYYRAFNIPNHDQMVTPFEGAKETLKTLHKKGYKLGVVSSKKTDLVKHGLEHFGLLEHLDIVVGADDVEKHKPEPDGILLAKEKLNGKNVAYIGDTLNDINAAKAAGVMAIGVLYIKDPSIMLEAKPDNVIEKLSDILEICGE